MKGPKASASVALRRNYDVGSAFVCQRSDQSRGDSQCVSYSLAQLSSQLRLDLQAAFTTSKPPTLNRWRARRSNSLDGPIGMDLLSRADGIAGYHGLDGKQILQKNLGVCLWDARLLSQLQPSCSVLPWRYHRSTRTKTLTTQA